MTREKANEISSKVFQIERYEALIDEIRSLNGVRELEEVFDEIDLEEALVAIVQVRLDNLLKELEEM